MKSGRLKVLLSFYACDLGPGSELGMGRNFVSDIAKHHEVHAIEKKNKFEEHLTSYAAEHPEAVQNITFHFVSRTLLGFLMGCENASSQQYIKIPNLSKVHTIAKIP